MKNLVKRALLLLCAFMLAAAMAACGSDKSDKSDDAKDKTEDTAKDEKEDDSDSDSDSDIIDKFESLDDFVNSDIMQEQLEQEVADLEGTGLSAEIIADGDKLIYNFTIEDADLAAVMDKAALDSTLESQTSTFEAIAASLPTAVENIENPTVVVRYLDPSGTEITSMEFYAN